MGFVLIVIVVACWLLANLIQSVHTHKTIYFLKRFETDVRCTLGKFVLL